MFATNHSLSLVLSSDPEIGALNRSADGSSFEVLFSEAIPIPKDAVNVEVSMQAATVWWTIANIQTGVNDKIYVTDNATPYVVTIPQGLYGQAELNAAVQRELANAGAPATLLVIGADAPTGKIVLQFGLALTSVDFTPIDTPRTVLGFNSQVIGPSAAPPAGGVTSVLAPNIAEFNTVNSFLIHGDLVSRGVQINGGFRQILGQVLIDVAPNAQILSRPFNPPRVPANELRGQLLRNVRMWLTDEKNRPVNTAGENWTATLAITYQVPHYKSVRGGPDAQ